VHKERILLKMATNMRGMTINMKRNLKILSCGHSRETSTYSI